jgi:hypothetical protein
MPDLPLYLAIKEKIRKHLGQSVLPPVKNELYYK